MPIVVHNNPKIASALMEAAYLNNKANQLEARGDLIAAEKIFLRALKLKIESTGEDSIQSALSKNALGELYLKMEGRWEDARRFLMAADVVRGGDSGLSTILTQPVLATISVNCGIKGDMVKAKAARERNPNSMICSNFNCSLSSANVKSKRENLKNCARCKATWYCSVQCQKVDWRSRHKKWCKEPQGLSAEKTSTSG